MVGFCGHRLPLAVSKEASRFLSWCCDQGSVGQALCFMTAAQDPTGRGQKQEDKQGEINHEKRIGAAEFLGKMWLWQEVYTQVQKLHYTLWTRGRLILECRVRHMIAHNWECNLYSIKLKSSHHVLLMLPISKCQMRAVWNTSACKHTTTGGHKASVCIWIKSRSTLIVFLFFN